MIQMNEKHDFFWNLLQPEYKRAMMYCRKLMQNREKGDDLFQDALMIGLRKIGQLKESSAFRPWLYRIIINQHKSALRKKSARAWLPFNSDEDLVIPQTDHSNSELAKIWLTKLFKVLSADEQALITLYEMEQWSMKELAHLHNKSEGAIKLKLFRTRTKLKKELQKLSQDETKFDDLYKMVNAYVM